ncbi:MAG: hypothetical protein CM1200mP30_00830 [Pseudomonadota bacterium]|nr:MAG: hypothetical protein CM1200mP30_00830 [Pseudomonadota bacterium]
MAKLFKKNDLPNFISTRDKRERLDLITENVPVGAKHLRADRIIYHEGDSCAGHYHIGSHHVFVFLEGKGKPFLTLIKKTFKGVNLALIEPEEIHLGFKIIQKGISNL